MKIFSILFLLASSQVLSKTLNQRAIIDLCLKNNPEIKLAMIDYKLAKAEIMGSKNDFDYNFSASLFQKRETSLPNLTYERFELTEKSRGYSIGFSKKFDIGANVELSYQNIRFTTNSINILIPKRVQGAALLSVEFPLLKGFGRKYNENQYFISKDKMREYKEALKKEVSNEIRETLKLSWDIIKKDSELREKKKVS